VPAPYPRAPADDLMLYRGGAAEICGLAYLEMQAALAEYHALREIAPRALRTLIARPRSRQGAGVS
jgi:hypothetical protein